MAGAYFTYLRRLSRRLYVEQDSARRTHNMYRRPMVLGLDMKTGPANEPLDQRLKRSGGNSGNILFSESLFRCVLDAKRMHSYSPSPEEIGDCDVIVMSAANWIGPHQDLQWLVEWIEQTPVPIVVVGLGAQAPNGTPASLIADQIPAPTRRFAKMIAERSNSISVRGHFSQDVLNAIGVKNTVATGCPSLLLFGTTTLKPFSFDTTWHDVAFHGTRYGLSPSSPAQQWFYRQSLRHDADIIFQSENADLSVLRNGQAQDRTKDSLSQVYNAPYEDVQRHLSSRGQIFWTLEDWTGFLSTKRFCVGTRIHGTIAALCAGTPATLVAHDSRTREMAEALSIPYIDEGLIDFNAEMSPYSFYKEGALTRFQDNLANYRNAFRKFFTMNRVPTTAPICNAYEATAINGELSTA